MTTIEAPSRYAFDSRDFPSQESNERLFDPIELATTEEILLIGAGMRHVDQDVLRFRWIDRHKVDGEPLLPKALETLQVAALVGLEHHVGGRATNERDEPHLRAFDILFAESPAKTHGQFISNISLVSQIQGKVFMFEDFTPTPRQADAFCETARFLQLGTDKFFEKQFYDEAQAAVAEGGYELSPRLKQLSPDILRAYLEKRYVIGHKITAKNYARISGDEGPLNICTWMLRQIRLLEDQLVVQR